MLQNQIAVVLDQHGITFRREVSIASRCRVDFMLLDGVVLEVKCGLTKPNRTRVVEQLRRYAQFDEVSGILLIVDRNLNGIPNQISGKPCQVMPLHKQWGLTI